MRTNFRRIRKSRVCAVQASGSFAFGVNTEDEEGTEDAEKKGTGPKVATTGVRRAENGEINSPLQENERAAAHSATAHGILSFTHSGGTAWQERNRIRSNP